MSSGAEHAQRAVELLEASDQMVTAWQAATPADQLATISRMSTNQQTAIAAAQTHALLAQVQYLREIGDQLDTLPRRHRAPYSPLWEAAALLESVAIGDEGSNREGTIARLVLQAARDEHYAGAAGIAEHALLDSFGRADHAAVREAVALLHIKVTNDYDVVPAEIVNEPEVQF